MNKIQEALPGYYAEGMPYLRQEIPKIKQIEVIEEFARINLISTTVIHDIIMVTYDVVCPELFPSVRARLLEKEFIKRHNVLHTGLTSLQDASREIKITLGYYGNCLQICLECSKEDTKTD